MFFLTNNIPESEVIFSGLKLIVERESTRVGVRGGKKTRREEVVDKDKPEDRHTDFFEEDKKNEEEPFEHFEGSGPQFNEPITSNFFVEEEPIKTPTKNFEEQSFTMNASHGSISSYDNSGEYENPSQKEISNMRYIQGQVIHTNIATNVSVPLPLPLCRALLVDSSSPLMNDWAIDRGDFNPSHGDWILKNAMSPRSVNYPDQKESELIFKANMTGASRTCAFERIRKGQRVGLSETWFVDIDDKDAFVFSIVERMPRRGFSLKIRVAVRPASLKSSDVTIVGETVPLGKNTTDQAVVHRAFILVVKELHSRYGLGNGGKSSRQCFYQKLFWYPQITHFSFPYEGLVGELLKINVPTIFGQSKVVESNLFERNNGNFQSTEHENSNNLEPTNNFLDEANQQSNEWVQFGQSSGNSTFNTAPNVGLEEQTNHLPPLEKKQSKYTSFVDINAKVNEINSSPHQISIAQTPKVDQVDIMTPQRKHKIRKDTADERPPTPSMKQRMKNEMEAKTNPSIPIPTPLNQEFIQPVTSNPIKIDVKPLPKIRLDLMPSPREADEEFEDDW